MTAGLHFKEYKLHTNFFYAFSTKQANAEISGAAFCVR
ncbi:conserved hypothetical protein [delta proteobacterium NaphS2]|nr:conserved hypothetical protein [delta proteobacterium NaphS2]